MTRLRTRQTPKKSVEPYHTVTFSAPESLIQKWRNEAWSRRYTLSQLLAEKLGFKARSTGSVRGRQPYLPAERHQARIQRIKRLIAINGGTVTMRVARESLDIPKEEICVLLEEIGYYPHDRGEGRGRLWIERIPYGKTYAQAMADNDPLKGLGAVPQAKLPMAVAKTTEAELARIDAEIAAHAATRKKA